MNRLRTIIIAAGIALSVSAAQAQVYVNGQQMTRDQIAWLAQYTCGPIFAGNYWINMSNGYWGYMGSPVAVGHLKDRCGNGRVFQDGNMSREGRLYYPGELLK